MLQRDGVAEMMLQRDGATEMANQTDDATETVLQRWCCSGAYLSSAESIRGSQQPCGHKIKLVMCHCNARWSHAMWNTVSASPEWITPIEDEVPAGAKS